MPTCYHNHIHASWPKVGALVICPGERTCGYCTGAEAEVYSKMAHLLRKHVYYEHTDGGKLDYAGVRVCLYPNSKLGGWERKRTGAGQEEDVEDGGDEGEEAVIVSSGDEEEDEDADGVTDDQGAHLAPFTAYPASLRTTHYISVLPTISKAHSAPSASSHQQSAAERTGKAEDARAAVIDLVTPEKKRSKPMLDGSHNRLKPIDTAAAQRLYAGGRAKRGELDGSGIDAGAEALIAFKTGRGWAR